LSSAGKGRAYPQPASLRAEPAAPPCGGFDRGALPTQSDSIGRLSNGSRTGVGIGEKGTKQVERTDQPNRRILVIDDYQTMDVARHHETSRARE
jgi:hypothetical protein